MKPLSADTPLEVERVWLAMLRERGPLWRLRRCVEMTSFSWRAAKEAVKRAHPGETERQWELRLLEQRYGKEIAEGVDRVRAEKGFYD